MAWLSRVFIAPKARVALPGDALDVFGHWLDFGVPRYPRSERVYFVSAGPVIKVGSSWKPRLRVGQLAEPAQRQKNGWCGLTEPRLELVVLGFDRRHEMAIHRAFRSESAWGEWYLRVSTVGLALDELLARSLSGDEWCACDVVSEAMRALHSDRPWRTSWRRGCSVCACYDHNKRTCPERRAA